MENDVSKLVTGPGVVTIGTENSATPSGTDAGIPGEMGYNLIIKPSWNRIKSGAYLMAVNILPTDIELQVTGAIMEADMSRIDAILGCCLKGALNGTGVPNYASIKVVGTKFPGGTATRTAIFSRGVFVQEFNHPFKLGEQWMFPFEFSALQGTTTPTYTLADSA